ncbi:MAG: ubiquinone/menaquinone biosynthesis methyltransferase [Candidatus Omnitrophota bacterium]
MPASYDKTLKYRLIEEVGFKDHFKADRWQDYNRQFFDGLAPKYDRLNEVLSLGQHRRVKQKALSRIGIRSGWKILDLCTGSGDMAIFLGRRYPDCEILGADVSEKMLEIARRRGKGLPNVRFVNEDTMSLRFPDRTFDLVLISFGLRNLDDLKAGLLEMKRVAKPGGFVVNLDLGQPPAGFFRWGHRLFFHHLIPFLGKTVFHRGEFNSFRYLPTSSKYFPSQSELVTIFEAMGFKDVKRYDYMFGGISQQIGQV